MKKIMLLLIMVCSLTLAAGSALAVTLSLALIGAELSTPGDPGSVDLVVAGLASRDAHFRGFLGETSLIHSGSAGRLAKPM